MITSSAGKLRRASSIALTGSESPTLDSTSSLGAASATSSARVAASVRASPPAFVSQSSGEIPVRRCREELEANARESERDQRQTERENVPGERLQRDRQPGNEPVNTDRLRIGSGGSGGRALEDPELARPPKKVGSGELNDAVAEDRLAEDDVLLLTAVRRHLLQRPGDRHHGAEERHDREEPAFKELVGS
jgi:hypothetical protein